MPEYPGPRLTAKRDSEDFSLAKFEQLDRSGVCSVATDPGVAWIDPRDLRRGTYSSEFDGESVDAGRDRDSVSSHWRTSRVDESPSPRIVSNRTSQVDPSPSSPRIVNRRVQMARDGHGHITGVPQQRPRDDDFEFLDAEAGDVVRLMSERTRLNGTLSEQVMGRWLDLAESGTELDIYTCLGLSNGCTLSADTRIMIKDIIFVTCLQIIVPVLMLVLEMEEGLEFVPVKEALSFRVIGFLLYLYSMQNMHKSACDECRSLWLEFALEHNLPVGYWWPPLLGEISNTVVSIVLLFTLFTIFCKVKRAESLIMNAVAVNFLGNIDVEFTTPDMKEHSINNYKRLHAKHHKEEESHSGKVLGRVLNIVLLIVREGGTRWAGSVFALLFLLSEQPTLCAHVPFLGASALCSAVSSPEAAALLSTTQAPSEAAFDALLGGSRR